MELVEGKTLRELLVSGALSLKRLLPLAAQVASGLANAHAAGIVHRDLKPENLMVTRDGLVKILDFGLAKLVPSGSEIGRDEPADDDAGTEAGTVLGTVGYMSPEQASGGGAGLPVGPVLVRIDSVRDGVGQAGVPAADGGSDAFGDHRGRAGAARADLAATPTNLVWIVERCLAKDPEERYGSTKDLARDLADDARSFLGDLGFWPSSPRRRAASRVSRIVLAAAALAFAVAALDFFRRPRVQKRIDRETPPPARQTLTFRRGFVTGARFAPDGQTIVYSAAWDGKPSEIFTTRVQLSESRPLGIFPAGILAISSAGEMAISLGCQNRGDPCFGTLARVPLAGGAPREVLENVGSADWSPDGKELAAIHVVEGRDRVEYPIGKVLSRPRIPRLCARFAEGRPHRLPRASDPRKSTRGGVRGGPLRPEANL